MNNRIYLVLSLLAVTAMTASCGQMAKRPSQESTQAQLPATEPGVLDGEAIDVGPELSEEAKTIPLVINKPVQKWINYYQGRGRKYMRRYLERSTRYSPLMKQILRQEGLPEDLIYVVFIESGFSSQAHSHANAVGYWQFIRGTGKRYGLKINGYVDERRDPVLSTHASSRFFKALYNLFGDWYLAMASYNTGENRVKRVVMRYGTRDFWTLRRRRKLLRETREYVPKILAAMAIGKNPEQYGFTDLNYQDPISYDTVKISRPISLKKLGENIGVSYKELKRLNPQFRTTYVPVYKVGQTIRVPRGMQAQALASLDKSFSQPAKMVADHFYYRVRRGDNLSYIAKKYRTRVSTLRRLNGLRRRSLLRIGQRLKVPDRWGRSVARSKARSRSRKKSSGSYGGVTHVVRRGENLSVIAQRYGLSISQLRRWNRLGRRAIIKVGQRLKIQSPKTKSNNSSKPSSRSRSQYHVVRRGENLSLIARKYGVSVRELKRWNKLGRRSLIRSGQRLSVVSRAGRRTVASARVHVIRRGETLTHIARKYRVPISKLASANDIGRRSRVMAGRKLVIPD